MIAERRFFTWRFVMPIKLSKLLIVSLLLPPVVASAIAPPSFAKTGMPAASQASEWDKFMSQGDTALAAKNYPEAEKCFAQAWTCAKGFLQNDRRRFKTLSQQLATCYASNKLKDAAPIFEQMVIFTETAKGIDDPDVMESLKNYAALLQRLGNNHAYEVVGNRIQALRKDLNGKHATVCVLSGAEFTDHDAAFMLDGLEPDILTFNARLSQITDKTLALLSRCKNVQKVDLTGTKITDAGLAKLNGLEDLQDLNLDTTNVTDNGLKSISDLPHLRSLNLCRTKTTGMALGSLTNYTYLQSLFMEEVPLSDAAVGQLNRLGSLEYFEQLDLARTGMTDAMVAKLTLPHLRQLNLYGDLVSDAVMPTLKRLNTLISVNVASTNVSPGTAAAIEGLLRSRAPAAPAARASGSPASGSPATP
jgi:hypothetical protein